MSFIHSLLSPEKSNLVWIREICKDQAPFTKLISSKQTWWWIFFMRDINSGYTYLLDKALLWIMHSYFSEKWWFNVKMMDLFLTNTHFSLLEMLTDGLESCGLLWCFYQLFGCWRHPFTAEHPLVSKWCNDTFLQIWWRNKLTNILDNLRMSR